MPVEWGSDNQLNLRMGDPDPELFASSYLAQAVERSIAGPIRTWGVGYAPDQGHQPLLKQLAREASLECGRTIERSEVLITNGATQGLDFAARLLGRANGVVLAPLPIYSEALKLFRDQRLDVIPFIPEGEERLAHAFERTADACTHQGRSVAFAFLIPTFNNPDGRCLTATERMELHEASSLRNIWIIEDDTYRATGSVGAPPPLYALGNQRVINVSSFSKSVCPALRLGRMLASPDVIAEITSAGYIAMSGGAGLITSLMLERIMSDDRWEDYKRDLRCHYGEKAKIAGSALRKFAPDTFTWRDPDGGFFVWISVKTALDSLSLVRKAEAVGVSIMPGDRFFPQPTVGTRFLRLSFSYEPKASLSLAIERLCRSLS